MCGIAGAVFWTGPRANVDAVKIVQAMTDALAHRGPDGEGIVVCKKADSDATRGPVVVFGHRRLAIIDLTSRAAQPMSSDRGPVCLSYNGEIYNFVAIRRQLESLGHCFRSDSDTEVILRGYEQWGMHVLDRLRGMFAFALWDGRKQELLLARDRLGIKPLYIHRSEGCLLFASEIRALLDSGLVPRRLDFVALDQFLAYQSVPPPRTLVDGVEMLAPGHAVTVSSGDQYEPRAYWRLLSYAGHAASNRVTPADARMQVRDLLYESVTQHLVSDVPVGVFLSGGVDSTVVTALVRRTGVTPRTFSVSCPGTPFDEGPYAKAAARACGAEHTEIVLRESEILKQLRDGLAGVDHPSGDGMNTFIVSQAVRQAGVKVALSGLGGDEFFGGYPSFDRIGRLSPYAEMWGRAPAPVRRAAAVAVRSMGGHSIAASKVAALVESDGSLPQTFPILRQLFSREQRRALLLPPVLAASDQSVDPYVALLDEATREQSDLPTMALVSYAEARTYMHDVLLRDTDQMSMRHGLEVRVPLLDHRLVEHLMGLPDSVKREGSGPKPLLVESLGMQLPEDCVQRPKKGFVLPFDLWMRGSLKPFCEHHLGPDGLAGRDICRSQAIAETWRAFLSEESRTSWSRVWGLVALNAWMESAGVRA